MKALSFRLSFLSVLILLCAGELIHLQAQATAIVAPGVSKALALDRAARVSGLRYGIHFTLAAHAGSMPGEETIRFTYRAGTTPSDLLLDYRDGNLASASLNHHPVSPEVSNGHLRLPRELLADGENTLQLSFTSKIAAAGAAITRYEDREDGSEYLYSLFVPMDASMAFPSFDQPDLKARFALSVDAPAEWTVVSNTRGTSAPAANSTTAWHFAETKPISTYLFAFAAGPWARMQGQLGEPDVYVRRSQKARAAPELPQLQHITAEGMRWLAGYFQQPFPFPKYDIVLIPGFPFGGMEHAGATFLREDGVLFRAAPTANDRFNRNILTLHELTHQWFGDLVTMRWFDDLWLKEGFAQYMAYRAVDALDPASQPWKHFYESIKPLAYGIDETPGTTPIFQDIPNLRDAKSAYGAIVYQKAPAILKQLEFRLGSTPFRDGLRLYLRQHAYSNARWSDLIDAFHTASGQDVRTWADAWVLRRGMPEVNAVWRCDAQNRIAELKLTQQDILPDGYVWPISNEVLLGYGGSGQPARVLRTDWNTAEHVVPEARNEPCPDQVFANDNDQAYGRFLLDGKSEQFVRQSILSDSLEKDEPEPLLRSMLWGALWDNVRVARSSPRGFVELALHNLPSQDDEMLSAILAAHATTALHFYMTAAARAPLVPQLEQVTGARMLRTSTVGLRIVNFRSFTAAAETAEARATLKELLRGQSTIPGVSLRPLDRWAMVGRLIALNDPEAQALHAAEAGRDHTDDGRKYAWATLAGVPDAETKQRYFAEYLKPATAADAKPEDWLTQSLRPFNSWNQSALTEPYLRKALDQLPEIKRDRKIFFLGAWLNAFFDGQTSATAEIIVQSWLAQGGIDRDLRLKVLEANDDLARTVRIRAAFPQ